MSDSQSAYNSVEDVQLVVPNKSHQINEPFLPMTSPIGTAGSEDVRFESNERGINGQFGYLPPGSYYKSETQVLLDDFNQ